VAVEPTAGRVPDVFTVFSPSLICAILTVVFNLLQNTIMFYVTHTGPWEKVIDFVTGN
jgi:hypothetical protein